MKPLVPETTGDALREHWKGFVPLWLFPIYWGFAVPPVLNLLGTGLVALLPILPLFMVGFRPLMLWLDQRIRYRDLLLFSIGVPAFVWVLVLVLGGG